MNYEQQDSINENIDRHRTNGVNLRDVQSKSAVSENGSMKRAYGIFEVLNEMKSLSM